MDDVSIWARLPELRTVEKHPDLDEVVEALLASAQVLLPPEDQEASAAGATGL